MAIITKPATIEKNSAATIVLNKSQLASEISDAYYADSTNWKEVFIYYKSSTGNQRKILKFNASQTSPEATFLASLKARNIFQVQKIVVMDFDGGSVIIPRADLTVVDFDIDMTPAPSLSVGPILWTNVGDIYNVELDGGLTNGVNRGDGDQAFIYAESQILTGDFDISFNIASFSRDTGVGVMNLSNTAFSGIYGDISGSGISYENSSQRNNFGGVGGTTFRMIRKGNTTLFLKNNIVLYYSTAIIGDVRPTATLRKYGDGVVSAANINSLTPSLVSGFSSSLKTNETILSNNNLIATSTDSGGYSSPIYSQRAFGIYSGKFYKEFTFVNDGIFSSNAAFGLRFFYNADPSDFSPNSDSGVGDMTDNEAQIFYRRNTFSIEKRQGLGAVVSVTGVLSPILNEGDIIGIAVDCDESYKALYISINGVWLNNANPSTGAGKILLGQELGGILDTAIRIYFTSMNIGQNSIQINESPVYIPAGYITI